MPLDPKKLRQDAKRLQAARPPSAVGRETTGTTSAIRAALPVIYQLRQDGVSWPAIAEALAGQGVIQGRDRTPLTTNRLTALVTQIEEQARRKARKAGSRARADTVNQSTEPARKLSLSADLVTRHVPSPKPLPSSEDDLRLAAFGKIQNVLKKEE